MSLISPSFLKDSSTGDRVPGWQFLPPTSPPLGIVSGCVLFLVSFSFFKAIVFWWCFRVTANLRGRFQRFPVYHLLQPAPSTPWLSVSPATVVPLLQLMNYIVIGVLHEPSEPTLTHHNHSLSLLTWAFTLGGVPSVSLGKCMIMCIHYYSIIQSIFTFQNILCVLPVYPFPQPLTTTDLFTVFIILPFPECHIVGIILYATFSDWLLALHNNAFKVSPFSYACHPHPTSRYV